MCGSENFMNKAGFKSSKQYSTLKYVLFLLHSTETSVIWKGFTTIKFSKEVLATHWAEKHPSKYSSYLLFEDFCVLLAPSSRKRTKFTWPKVWLPSFHPLGGYHGSLISDWFALVLLHFTTAVKQFFYVVKSLNFWTKFTVNQGGTSGRLNLQSFWSFSQPFLNKL